MARPGMASGTAAAVNVAVGRSSDSAAQAPINRQPRRSYNATADEPGWSSTFRPDLPLVGTGELGCDGDETLSQPAALADGRTNSCEMLGETAAEQSLRLRAVPGRNCRRSARCAPGRRTRLPAATQASSRPAGWSQ